MITLYTSSDGHVLRGGVDILRDDAVWIDLLSPTPEEERAVEAFLDADIPTREEMQEIEASSRLSRVDGVLTVTTPALTNSSGFNPENTSLAFVLLPDRLVTVRYGTPKAFTSFTDRLEKSRTHLGAGEIMLQLLEALVDRMADVLERVAQDLDAASHRIFHQPIPDRPRRRATSRDLEVMLRTIGRGGDLQSKARDTIMGLKRIAAYLPAEEGTLGGVKDARARIKVISRDLQSLSEYADFQANKVAFLLDATLGMINIQQNNIIKLFSVVSVLLMPPTLVASIYGMNFHHMPELDQPWGYPFALALMLVVAIVPFWLFKRKGWM